MPPWVKTPAVPAALVDESAKFPLPMISPAVTVPVKPAEVPLTSPVRLPLKLPVVVPPSVRPLVSWALVMLAGATVMPVSRSRRRG